jgi:hypothetical protein
MRLDEQNAVHRPAKENKLDYEGREDTGVENLIGHEHLRAGFGKSRRIEVEET